MKQQTGGLWEWVVPFSFVVCASWAIWHLPAYILTIAPHENASKLGQVNAIHQTKDVTPNLPGLFGGVADIVDWLAVAMLPVLILIGMRTVKVAQMEFQHWRAIDRIALFFGRVTMMLIISMTLVMLYEVFVRYALEQPTLWANELTLWIGGFVFLLSGFYGMQQRSHIRIFLLYDAVPRWLQKVFDTTWTIIFVLFAVGLVFGSYKQVFITKFYNWEMFGTAFDPPIPATVQPAVLIIICLVALQSVLNLISDWNLEPEVHSVDDIDQEELEAIKRSVGAE
ncbi:TRAP-type C4-dicarboxylate transport system, small permease component [Candidatus Rhodobacter oscarellae]|uniref:TRAP transporter small permease protein n=1 Tax=Candidatus Rhodobacter oscarellae TaxID=1675527 RepID=A0A0J9GTJ2_9RHOB|nr:TRAP transporter small permease [Candidatus Rhodobacter lobularis]KMW56818.1 TRAP-type C4-dicarboxylate transport system, small permease component [Candidatus Rhodobacter lobularis]